MIYIIIFIAVVIPLICKRKDYGLFFSMIVLFIPWGLQYKMVQDWNVNLNRWMIVNESIRFQVAGSRDLEPLYVFLLHIFKPFGFYGWLMISAAVELLFIFFFVKKYVKPQYYWLSIFFLMIRVDYGLLFINSNRQSWSIIFVLFAVLVLFNELKFDNIIPYARNNVIIRIVIASIIIYVSKFIHGASILSFGVVLIYICSIYVRRTDYLVVYIIMNFLFFTRFFFDASVFQDVLLDYYDYSGAEKFDVYIEEFDNMGKTLSYVWQPYLFLILNACIRYYKEVDVYHKFFCLNVIFYIIISAFLTGNLTRSLEYYYIYLIFLLPAIFVCVDNDNLIIIQKSKRFVFILFILYCCYSFCKTLNDTYVYERWREFTTIFSELEWK